MRRMIILSLIGLFIIGGSLGLTAIELSCGHCGGFGKIVCLACGGVGAVFIRVEWVECGCRGENFECLACRGKGGYLRPVVGACEICGGSGGEICLLCQGTGKIRGNQRILQIFGMKVK